MHRPWMMCTEHDKEHQPHRPNIHFEIVISTSKLWCSISHCPYQPKLVVIRGRVDYGHVKVRQHQGGWISCTRDQLQQINSLTSNATTFSGLISCNHIRPGQPSGIPGELLQVYECERVHPLASPCLNQIQHPSKDSPSWASFSL